MSHMRVSKSVEKAFQLDFLKLKRRRKGVVVGVTAALIRMAIGRCWVYGIGSSTALLLSDAMLLLTKERSGLYPRFQRLMKLLVSEVCVCVCVRASVRVCLR